MTKRRLRPWVKYTLVAIVSAIVSIAIYQLFTFTAEPNGNLPVCNPTRIN